MNFLQLIMLINLFHYYYRLEICHHKKINLMYHYVVLIIHLNPIWVIPVSIICGCRAAGRYRKQ
jgi:hypothetical protein